jgi:hypothetical protein
MAIVLMITDEEDRHRATVRATSRGLPPEGASPQIRPGVNDISGMPFVSKK